MDGAYSINLFWSGNNNGGANIEHWFTIQIRTGTSTMYVRASELSWTYGTGRNKSLHYDCWLGSGTYVKSAILVDDSTILWNMNTNLEILRLR